MLKIILSLVIVVICSLIGFAVERIYKTRLKVVEEYRDFIGYVERETEFLKTDLKQLLASFECSTELKKLLSEIAETIDSGKVKCQDKWLKECVINEICAFITDMSGADYYGKNAIIKHASCVADEMVAIAKKEKIQKGELIRKLMILLGIGLVVIIL